MPDDDLPHALLQTWLQPLAKLLTPLAGSESMAAWDAAIEAANAFNPKTVTEFRLAVRICVYNIRAHHFCAQSAEPGLSPTAAIRMSQCALSYARDADKAERQLEKLQAERMEQQQPQPGTLQVAPAPVEQTITPTPEPDVPQTPEPRPVPAYKLLKQARREAKQRDREARLKAQAEVQPKAQAAAEEAGDPDLPLAA